MAHITEIKIDGLLWRSQTLHFKLNRNVNIFFGSNGGGKTTLLKILDAAMSRNGSVMEDLPVQRAEVHIYSIAEQRNFKHVWERRESKDTEQSEFVFYLDDTGERRQVRVPKTEKNPWQSSPRESKGRYTHWHHTFLPTTRLYLDTRTRQKERALTERELDAIFTDNVNRSWLTFYSQVMTKVSELQDTGLRNVALFALASKLKDTEGPSAEPIQAYERVSRFLRRGANSSIGLGSKAEFLKRYENEEHLRRIVSSLNILESQIEEAMIPITRFQETVSGLLSDKKLQIRDGQLAIATNNERPLEVANLSSGEKHLLRIFLDAMQCGPNSLIIDEPELSMHIDWQRRFVSSVNSINSTCQLIIASHSPEVMAEVDDECIYHI